MIPVLSVSFIDFGLDGRLKIAGIKVGMHGCSSGSALLVNAEVDSMGGVVDGGIGIGLKTSPRRAAIEKAQAELRFDFSFVFTPHPFQLLLLDVFPVYMRYMSNCYLLITDRSMMCGRKEEGS